jgi:uncharacterized membrane protein HdeD (DUF308 family)
MSLPMEAISQRSPKSSVFLATILIVLGLLAMTLPAATSIGAVKVFAWLIIFDGFVQFIYAFQSKGVGRIAWKVLVSVLYLGGGAYLLTNPHLGIADLVFILAIFFLAEGMLDIFYFFLTEGNGRSIWQFLHGILALVFGLMIWSKWPSDSFWVIGTILGVSMFMSGFSRLFMALDAPST